MKMNTNTEKRVASLEPEFAKLVRKLLDLAYVNGLNAQIASGYRSPEEQDALYSVGRTRPGKIVTNAKRYQSAHNWKVAVDIFFLVNNKASWDRSMYFKLWNLAKGANLDKMGLEWAYNWKSFKEMPHFQLVGFDWREYCRNNYIDIKTLESKV